MSSNVEEINEREKPFMRHDRSVWHPLELLKFIVFWWFVPLRTLMFMGWVLGYGVLALGGTMGVKDFDKPLSPVRRWFVNGSRRLVYVVNNTFPYMWHLGFYYTKVTGDWSMERDGQRCNIIVPNHCSYFDILVLMHVLPEVPSFTSKAETLSVPLFGRLARAWQCIFVERKALRTEGVNSDATKAPVHAKGIVERIRERGLNPAMPPLVIFPEETTTNNRYLISFKAGAFVPGLPVKPVVFKYSTENFSPTWESCFFPWHFVRSLCQWYNFVEVICLPVYIPNEAEKKDPQLYANNVRKAMSEASGLPLNDANFTDKINYLKRIRGEFKSD